MKLYNHRYSYSYWGQFYKIQFGPNLRNFISKKFFYLITDKNVDGLILVLNIGLHMYMACLCHKT
jgi:hypothetical protein